MHAALSLLNHFALLSRLSSTALIAAIWQGTLLVGIAALALRLAPRIPAAARFAIWFAVFTLVAALPFLNASSTVTAITSPASARATWLQFDSRWTLIIAVLWVAASLFRAATLIAAAFRVHTLARNATPIDLSSALTTSTPRSAQICSSADIDRPTVIGFFTPRILIPAWLIEKLTPAEIDHIVLHESGHLNRADDWLNLLQKLALVLFPLNPALAWVERRLCFERELACDERVLNILASRQHGAAIGYASSLTTLAEYRLHHRGLARNLALALGALGTSVSTSELGRRVARILNPAARMRPLHVRLATSAAIAALLLTTTELEHSPQLISFTSPASATQLASAAPQLLPGYHAVAARITLPAAAQIGHGASHLTPAYSRNITPSASGSTRRDIVLRAVAPSNATQQRAALRLTGARQSQPQSDFVITRYTVFQSSDGTRIVRTSAIFTTAPYASPSMTDSGSPSRPVTVGPDAPAVTDAPRYSHSRAQSIAQDISPYAAVPVPGGWLVFQL